MLPTVLITYVHGALSSANSFNYISEKVNDQCGDLAVQTFFEYDIKALHASDLAFKLAAHVQKQVKQQKTTRVIFVGHSFGGCLSIVAADYIKPWVESQQIITMASPLGGVDVPFMLRILNPGSLFFQNVHQSDNFMKSVREMQLPCKLCSMVTTSGDADWISQPNDSVVTLESQLHFKHESKIEKVDLNHFEILLSDKPVQRISEAVLS